jgi:hypothetical protein
VRILAITLGDGQTSHEVCVKLRRTRFPGN